MGFLSKLWENWGKGLDPAPKTKSGKKAPTVKKAAKKKAKKKTTTKKATKKKAKKKQSLYLRCINKEPLGGWEDSTFNHGVTARKNAQTSDIRQEIESKQLDLKGKKVLCLAGGVGRGANDLRQFGCEVTNSDVQEQYVTMGKRLYPEVKHIWHDILGDPLSGYDYVVNENCWSNTMSWKMNIAICSKWKDYATLLPTTITLKIWKFNSKMLSDYYKQEEEVGTKHVEDYFSHGVIEGIIPRKFLQDLEEKDFVLDLTNPFINIPECTTHDYQLFGIPMHGLPVYLKGLFVNKGYKEKFSNSNIFRKQPVRRNRRWKFKYKED